VFGFQINPVVVRIVDEPTPETTVADILIGAVGFVGAVLLAALLVGCLAGVIFILVRKRRARGVLEDTPSITASQFTR
jgi:hypothetical protein